MGLWCQLTLPYWIKQNLIYIYLQLHVSIDQAIPSTSGIQCGSEDNKQTVKETSLDHKSVQKKQNIDHDYSFFGAENEPPKKRKKTDPMSAYEETIKCLKSIETTMQVGFESINVSIKEGFQQIVEAIKRPK